MYIAYRTVNLVHIKGYLIARCHGFGNSRGGLHGQDLFFVPCLHARNLCLFLPVLNDCAAVFALQIKARHCNKVICTYLNIGGLSAFKIKGKLKAVVNLIGRDIGNRAVYTYYFFLYNLQNLVDKVHAPIEYHTAAVGLVAAPVARYSARAVYSRFNVYKFAYLARIYNLLHCKKVNVPPSVLVNGEEFSRFIGGGNHFIKRRNRHFNRLFANNVFALFKRLYNKLLVAIVRHGYYNRVNRRICQYFIVRSVSMYSVFLGKLSFFRVNIVNAGKRGNVARKYLPCVPAALTAVAYNRKILFHKGYHSSIFLILGQSISLR